MLQVMASVIGGFTLSEQELLTLANDLAAITGGMAFPIPLELFGLTPYGRGMQARRRVERIISRQLALYRTVSTDTPHSLLQVCQWMLVSFSTGANMRVDLLLVGGPIHVEDKPSNHACIASFALLPIMLRRAGAKCFLLVQAGRWCS